MCLSLSGQEPVIQAIAHDPPSVPWLSPVARGFEVSLMPENKIFSGSPNG